LTFAAASRALELDPSLNEARSFATTADPDNWQWIHEIEALDALVKAEPGNVSAKLVLTYDLKNTGYFSEAFALADRAIELEPLAAYAYLRKGEALSAAGRREEAQAAWLKAGELGDELAYSHLGADQLIAGNDEIASDYFAMRSRLEGEDPQISRSLIQNARNQETGKAFLDEWINDRLTNPSNMTDTVEPYIWYLLFGYLDDYFAGVRKLRGEGSGSGWNNADVLENMGMIFRASGYTSHPAYLEFAEPDGLFDLWDKRGAPDHCQKVDGDWVCQ